MGLGFPKGGFIGVDVFFVLSGFLITGLLLSEAKKRGYVSIGGFYQRRARRILPAATLTLVVTDVAAFYLLNFVRAKQVMWDSLSASLFAANIHFAKQGTDYFVQGQPPSPLQHFWTLAVEEQFYLFWPAVLSVVLFGIAFSRRYRQQRTGITEWAFRRLLTVAIVAAIASFIWSIYDTGAQPTSAYFSTFARAWELALGAVLAIVASRVRVPSVLRVCMGWLGLIGIVAAGAMYSSSTPFPGYAALLPTVGAALVIAAGIGGQQPRLGVGRLLAISPLRYVGDRSYTLYLWHWPVLVIAAEYEGHELSLIAKVLLVLGAFLLSVITYGLYENPIRRMDWRGPASVFAFTAAVAASVFVAAFYISSIDAKALRLEVVPVGTESSLLDPAQAAKVAAAGDKLLRSTASGQALPAVVAAVKATRRGDSIPSALAPPVSDVLSDIYSPPAGCSAHDGQTTSNICRLGDTSSAKSIVVMGDSHAQMWMPAILSMAQKDGWVVNLISKTACTPGIWTADFGDHRAPECHAWYRWAVGQVKVLHPDVTLITGDYGGGRGQSADVDANAISSLTTTLKRFSKRVVIVGDDAGIDQQPVDCLLARGATMASCTTTWTEDRFSLNDDIAARAELLGVGYVDTSGWFCFEYQCPMVIGQTIAYRDTNHITATYAQDLSEPFRVAFQRAIQPKKTVARTSSKTTSTRAPSRTSG
jgi:peptidoglycan/LPS O-acetylase OafA/YrhL